jgi:hypothetical protein
MNHTVTILDLFGAFAFMCGFFMVTTGMLANFAAGMSSAPSEGDGRKGCLIFFIGAFIVAAVIFRYN